MGNMYAAGLAESTDLRTGITINLRSNHYPPLPVDYVDPIIEAIAAVEDGAPWAAIALPLDINPAPRIAKRDGDELTIAASDLLEITHSWSFVADDLDSDEDY